MLHPYTYLVALHSLGITHREFRIAFLEEYTQIDTPDYQSIYDSIYTAGGIFFDEKKTEKRKEKQAKIDIQKISILLTEKDIHIVLYTDPVYPDSLRQISHAPYFLYVRGDLKYTQYSIGVVGSRKSTTYAERVLRYILPDLVQQGFAIVSGGAYGVDTLAHTLALEYSGYTIAVMGTGIDRAYPAANASLFQKIIHSGGVLISHFPLGTWPDLYNFPIRNEIVAGISRGILIPEAAEGSGTLITAQLALEHSRDVYAVPGDIDRETSRGVNMLISTGQAKCTRSAADILEEYIPAVPTSTVIPTPVVHTWDSVEQEMVYTAIQIGCTQIDNIAVHTGYAIHDVLGHITLLEIHGIVYTDTSRGIYVKW